MTYTVKHRFQVGAPMMCEYLCPKHGRFEQLVARDENGDPPETSPCIEVVEDNMEEEEWHEETLCYESSTLCLSAPAVMFWSRAWTPINPPGSTMHQKDLDPRALRTDDLATGKVTKAEWRKQQKEDRMRRWHEKKIKLGLAERKIQV